MPHLEHHECPQTMTMIDASIKMFLNPFCHNLMIEVTLFLQSGFREQVKHHWFQGSTEPMLHWDAETFFWLFQYQLRHHVFDRLTQNRFGARSIEFHMSRKVQGKFYDVIIKQGHTRFN